MTLLFKFGLRIPYEINQKLEGAKLKYMSKTEDAMDILQNTALLAWACRLHG